MKNNNKREHRFTILVGDKNNNEIRVKIKSTYTKQLYRA